MNPEQLLRKLIVRAPPDLFAAICISDRARRAGDAPRPSWEEIVRAAEELGIFVPCGDLFAGARGGLKRDVQSRGRPRFRFRTQRRNDNEE